MQKYFTFAEKLLQDINLLRIDDDFLADVEKLRDKYKLPVPDEEKIDMQPPEIYLNSLVFHEDIEELIIKYKLSAMHFPLLSIFVQEGHFNFDLDEALHFIYLNPFIEIKDEIGGYVDLKIYPGTTLKDIRKNWWRIRNKLEVIKKKSAERNIKSKNIERDLHIYELKKQGKTCTEISKIIGVSYQDVSKIIKRLKERAKRNIPRKET
jgi:hypothetical protein